MRLILVRHGETDWNQQNRAQGQADTELNETGRQQAEDVAQALKNEPIEAIYASPLKRALETAQAIARLHQVGVQTEEELKELDAGALDGLTYREMRERYGDFLKDWIRDAALLRLPGGECLQELQDRAWASIQRIVEKHPKGTVVVVSHYFAISSVICRALGLNLSHFRRLHLDIGATSVLEVGERGPSLVLFNDTCHLGKERAAP